MFLHVCSIWSKLPSIIRTPGIGIQLCNKWRRNRDPGVAHIFGSWGHTRAYTISLILYLDRRGRERDTQSDTHSSGPSSPDPHPLKLVGIESDRTAYKQNHHHFNSFFSKKKKLFKTFKYPLVPSFTKTHYKFLRSL